MSALETFDAIIAGGGIGGDCAAISLAKRGHRVLLLEAGEFPRHKVCGEFLSPDARPTLRRLGILDAILAAGAREISMSRLTTGRGFTVDIPLPQPALGLSRHVLDKLLWEAARQAGADCRTLHRVSRISREGEDFIVTTGQHIFRARSVLDATGRARLTHRQQAPQKDDAPRFMGLKAHFTGIQMGPDVVELHFWRGGYCGLARVEGETFNVCLLARYASAKPRGESPSFGKENAAEGIWSDMLAACSSLKSRMQGAVRQTPWLANANVQFAAHWPCGEDDVLRCGDAAGYIHSLAGDGMAMAARSGELAAAVVNARLRGSLDLPGAAALYEAAWRREFAPRLERAEWLSRLLLNPTSASGMIKLVHCAPWLAQMFVRNTRGHMEAA